MKKYTVLAVVATLVAIVAGNTLAVAQATPAQTRVCSACHAATTAVKVTARKTSANRYTISAPGARAIAVFYKGKRVAVKSASSVAIKTVKGRAYTLYAVNGYPKGYRKATLAAK